MKNDKKVSAELIVCCKGLYEKKSECFTDLCRNTYQFFFCMYKYLKEDHYKLKVRSKFFLIGSLINSVSNVVERLTLLLISLSWRSS